MRPFHRWALVAVAAVVLVATPFAVRALPADGSSVSAASLLDEVVAGERLGFSGTVESHGGLGLPVADHFSDLADLLGGTNRLRVWWRSAADWRVDRLLDTGEVDLIHHSDRTVEWDYERNQATTGIDPSIRLPRDADLLPPELARRALDGVGPDDVSRLDSRRVAGIDAPGLRIVPADRRTTITRVDLWADPATGLALDVRLYGAGSAPVMSSAFTDVTVAPPPAARTTFEPGPSVEQRFDSILDIADAANQYAPVIPPGTVAGLAKSPSSAEAVGVYGAGLTEVIAIPLRRYDAGPLWSQLKASGSARVRFGQQLRVGPLGVVLTVPPAGYKPAWLVAGTVDDRTLLAAARDVRRGMRFQ